MDSTMDMRIFETIKTIAIVGLSDNKERPSYEVGYYLKSKGYKIIPINPNFTEWEGEKAYPDLLSVPKEIKIDVVDIFRRSEAVLPIVVDAVKRGGVKVIWMQEGVINKEAEEYAKSKGLEVVVNFCMMKARKSVENIQGV